MERRPQRWPGLRARELDEFFRELRRALLEAEDAHQHDILAAHLAEADTRRRLGPGLVRAYAALAQDPRPDDPLRRRRTTVHALLDQARAEVFQIETWLHASLVEPDDSGGWRPAACLDLPPEAEGTSETPPETPFTGRQRFVVKTPDGGEVALRLDQVVARRFWGIAFVLDDEHVTDELANMLAASTTRHLARDLRDLQKLMRRVLSAEPDRFPELVPERESRAFEQLMVDLLNDEAPLAQSATLAEDYSQKTDLRVRYPGLQRRRGARVQVTRIIEPSRHLDKVAAIRRHNEFVILSPLSLARFVDAQVHAEPGSAHVLSADELAAFWSALPGQPMDVDALAHILRDILCGALQPPLRDPRGPAARVPSAVAHVLRVFVRREALRTTAELRAWESAHGPYRAGRDGRLHPVRPLHTTTDVEVARALTAFAEVHPPGTRVHARVLRTERAGAWLELADGGATAYLPREELAWGHAPAHTREQLAPGQELDVVVTVVRPEAERVLVSLRALRSDPWRDGADSLPVPGDELSGRIVHEAPYGLFVELARDVIGLVHASGLPAPDEHGRWPALPCGSSIAVRVERVDPVQRRLALTLVDGGDALGDASPRSHPGVPPEPDARGG